LEVAAPDPSVFEVLDYVIGELGQERYVASTTGGITALTRLGGTENGLVLLALEPEVVLAANRQSVARQNLLDQHYIRPGASGVLMEQDMAGSNGPLVSPSMYRELCHPFLRERIANVKRFTQQVIFHNCGNNIPLMEMFIEAGIDCYQSLQTTAGMEVGVLKTQFGDRLAFWGGVPVETLIDGSPDETRAAVRAAMERGAPGGGFILGPSHSVAMNTKYDNFMAMLDEFVGLRDRY
jgi:uroporphyrinogen-III decarboxylase